MGRSSGLGLALIALAAGCGGAAGGTRDAALLARTVAGTAEPPLATPANGLFPGESMTFVVALGGVEAGEAALAVGTPGKVDGREAIVVSSRVASSGAFRWVKEVDDELTSTIDLETGLPTKVIADVTFGAKRYHSEGTFQGALVDLAWHKGDDRIRHTRYDFGAVDAHDAHTAMAAMRTWEGQPGETQRLYIVGGRRIWRTDVTWAGRETIGTQLGNQSAVRLDGESVRVTGRLEPEPGKKARTFSVWMSDDADRVPLKVIAHTELGDVVIELTGYERP
jgi:hypothetical protein